MPPSGRQAATDAKERREQLTIRFNKAMLLLNVALLTALALSFVAQWLGWFHR
jgi:hypothetical protein